MRSEPTPQGWPEKRYHFRGGGQDLTPDQITAAATLIGSLFTAASVWFAMFAYRRGQDKSLFASLRASLIDIQIAVARLDDLLSELRFDEVGNSIAHQLSIMIGVNAERASILNFLENAQNHDLIASAILMGINRSETAREIDETTRNLQRLPHVNANQIPLLRQILSGCISYATQTAHFSTSPRLFDRILGTADGRTEMVIPNIQRRDTPELIYQELALVLSAASGATLRLRGQAILDDIRIIVRILVQRVASLSDAELRKLGRRLSGVVIKDPKETTTIEDVFVRLDKMRSLFPADEWDSLVEAKARIQEKAHPADENDPGRRGQP